MEGVYFRCPWCSLTPSQIQAPEGSIQAMTHKEKSPEAATETGISTPEATPEKPVAKDEKVTEIGGPKGLEPTRYGDWEKNGRCIDF
jgi:hypothetical protein